MEVDSEILPFGWVISALPEVANIIMGQSPPSATYNTTQHGLPFYQGKTEFGEIHPIPRKYCSSPGKIASAGDVLISVRAPVGPTNLCQEKSCIGRGLAAIQPHGGIPSQFLLYFFRRIEPWLSRQGTGSTFTAISRTDLAQIQLPIPPLSEQHRIVAKLEELLSKVDACQKRLERIPLILKRFRQSVLAAACSGRLTEKWRASNESLEPGKDLISRIVTFLESQPLKPKELEHLHQTIEPESVLATLGLEDVPETWAPCNMGMIGRVCNGSTPSRKSPKYWGRDVPWVSSGEVRNNIITDTRERISRCGLEESSLRVLPRGTVLVAMIGEGKTRGQSAVLDIEGTTNQNVAAILVNHGLVDSRFLWLWLQYQYFRTREVGSGSGPQALNCERVRELPFLLPGLPEQSEIVRRVEALFKLTDQIEARYNTAKTSVDQLTQSILGKAFRGELVPQDPKDEPATALLGRISTHRGASDSSQRIRTSVRRPGAVADAT